MKRKLTDEEYDALLNIVGSSSFSFKKLSDQSRLFRACFYFLNVYAVIMILIYIIVSQLILHVVNPELVKNGYLDLLGSRAFIFFWMLGAINISFYFGASFRLILTIVLLYTVNVSIEQALTIYGKFQFSEIPFLAAYTMTRPLFMLSIVVSLWSYRDT